MRYLIAFLLPLAALAAQPVSAQTCYRTAYGGYSCYGGGGYGRSYTAPAPYGGFNIYSRPPYQRQLGYPQRSSYCYRGPFGTVSCY